MPRSSFPKTLSDAALDLLAALSDADRAALAPDVMHLAKHPDPHGDASGLRFSLQLHHHRKAKRGRSKFRVVGNPPRRGANDPALFAAWKDACEILGRPPRLGGAP